MKQLKLIAIFLTIVILQSCNKHVDNSFAGYYFSVNMQFTDLNGTDLIMGIPCDKSMPYYVLNEHYNVEFITKRVYLSGAKLDSVTTNQSLCVLFSTGHANAQYQPETIEFMLISKYIFKDKIARKVTTTWQYQGLNPICTGIKFEDKEQTLIKNNRSGMCDGRITIN